MRSEMTKSARQIQGHTGRSSQRLYDLSLLLDAVELNNLPEEVDLGMPVGQEIWPDVTGKNAL